MNFFWISVVILDIFHIILNKMLEHGYLFLFLWMKETEAKGIKLIALHHRELVCSTDEI